jgi:hypothetical protein
MYVLFYDYVEDILERRAPHREQHLARLREWKAEGKIAIGGALGDPPHGALIVFSVDDPAEVERFAAEDPYVLEGLVTARRIQPFAAV